ncbi:hypothetical protein BJ138DRAFT_1223476 [Hygrophoropsis aurantiaca]|uniref:Uncharacterized protein n=1 Tax=Hygrophoropsis aurantiaca TaxID=72124 RepID=A0ACB7ZZS7_9AGAM|nr:hypothetical protein BJ138DRAFT_1223476 [Hygrophoropsis aurantiaca]
MSPLIPAARVFVELSALERTTFAAIEPQASGTNPDPIASIHALALPSSFFLFHPLRTIEVLLSLARPRYKVLANSQPGSTDSEVTFSSALLSFQSLVTASPCLPLPPLAVEVERSTLPTAIELCTDEAELADPTSHPVRVTLERLDKDGGVVQNEIVRAKFVLGADGKYTSLSQPWSTAPIRIWGVVDMVPVTDFPDIRNKSLNHSNNGSCLLVSREADRIRIYLQLADNDVLNPNTGRVDKDKMCAAQLLHVAQKSIYPYKLIPTNGINWWTLFSSEILFEEEGKSTSSLEG